MACAPRTVPRENTVGNIVGGAGLARFSECGEFFAQYLQELGADGAVDHPMVT